MHCCSNSDKVYSSQIIPYHVYIRFMNIQVTIYPCYMMSHSHVGRPPLRSFLTASMEATKKGKACTAMMERKAQCNLILTG